MRIIQVLDGIISPSEEQMRVFLSWSGDRSKRVAEALRNWLPRVIQSLKPWMSQEDISAGARWLADVSEELAQSTFGIICITPENKANEWLLFEAGALSKTLASTYVCPLLLEMSPGQLSGPLVQFQAVEVSKDGLERVLFSLNKALGANQLASSDLSEVFEVWWPKLEAVLKDVPQQPELGTPKRAIEELLEEAVSNSREQLRRENVRLEAMNDRDRVFDEMNSMLRKFLSAMTEIPESLRKSFPDAPQMFGQDSPLRGAFPIIDAEAMLEMTNRMRDLAQAQTNELLKAAKAQSPVPINERT